MPSATSREVKTGEDPRPASDEVHRLWFHRQEECLEALRSGEAVEVVPTAYGGNDFCFEFLMGSGLWPILTGMVPDKLKKENGAPWKALNGVEVIRELSHVERIAGLGKVLSDVRLMLLAGFNVEAVGRAAGRGRHVVKPETLSNHLARISPRSAQATFLEHLKLLRRERWLRGQVYAVDAHEIILPYGRKFDRMGKVGEKYGYKLLLLLNIEEERERVVGFVLAPLWHSERTLLKLLLRRLTRQLGPIREFMKVLVMDRGYWGARFLLGLKAKYGIDVVTRVQHDELDVAKDVAGILALGEIPWESHRETTSRLGEFEVRCAAVPDVPLRDGDTGKVVGTIQIVAAEEFDLQGRPLTDPNTHEVRGRWLYATTLPVHRRPRKIRGYYGRRWVIENQGFRELTQRWDLDVPAGRRFNLIHARITFALMLYNVDHILRMKFPGTWQEERNRLKRLGVASPLDRPGIAAYTDNGALGLLKVSELREALRIKEERRWVERLEEAARRGESIDSFLRRIRPDG
jgi:hypothetical protein